ncbi:CoA transferase [Emcibacter sp.]|uniref:CaiB/BaiF CoA transferase family protein n=1 Tax=Emcibacter sp. TaxID=1979954 RepID=UPI002AA7AEFC|nr:CoA transferase [Emcibacter sp.]
MSSDNTADEKPSEREPRAGLLSDIRVLDFGRYVAGPYCATLLGYLGAEIIRIEKPSGGEDRYIAPLTDGPAPTEGGVFFQTACNKKSLTLDLSSEEGRNIVRELVKTADVVVCSMPPAALHKLGLDYDSLTALKSDIILTNVTAFGTSGPYSGKGGFDGIGQAMSGAMHITGTPGHPVKAAAPYVDYTTAVLGAFGTLAALMEKKSSGRGQQVDTSLMGTAMSVFASHLIEQGVTGKNRIGTGNRVQTSAPSDVFETGDGFILVHTVGNGLFRRLARLIGREDWLDNPAYATDQSRGDHANEICEVVADWCRNLTTEETLARLEEAGLPAGKVLTPQEALDHPQVSAMNIFQQVSFPGLPHPAPVPDLPVKLSYTRGGIKARPPQLGEQTDEILTQLGYTEADIKELRDQTII